MKYTLMHRDVPVMYLEIDNATNVISKIGDVVDAERIPIGISVKKNLPDRFELNSWWLGRSIPASRQNIQEAMMALGISNTNILLTRCFGLSLSDQYWVNPVKNPLAWDKINFFENSFSEDVGSILFDGKPRGKIDLVSPNNTSDGWLKKRWIIKDDKRVLVKGGSGVFQQEPHNEVIASAICRRLGLPHAKYTVTIEKDTPYSLCENFVTSETELVPAWRVWGVAKKKNHDSRFEHILRCADFLGVTDARTSLHQMLVLDFIIANEDRHFNNFGFIRDARTLEWLGAAPIFDNGTSIWYNTLHVGSAVKSKPFRNRHEEQIKLVSDFSWLNLSALAGIEEEIKEILATAPLIDEARTNAICAAVEKQIKKLNKLIPPK